MMGVFKMKASSLPQKRSFSSKLNERNSKMFDKILIANRGEIACRVMRTAKQLGIKTVAVFSEADSKSIHVGMADEAYLLGPPPASQIYLLGHKILEIAKKSGAQAIHPGYGFLSENAAFAALCKEEGVVFIGPPPSAITAMGSKSESKKIMINANVPVVPGYHEDDQTVARLKSEAERIGFPVLIKAVMGGGGKGMRIVEKMADFDDALSSAQREAKNSFGDERVLIEKYISKPRHIELQIFADSFGNAVHLFERDCSVQRRHQKVIEEAPAPGLTWKQREAMGQAAVNAAKAVGYQGAGTVEFIVNEDMSFYFMEMNTRLQVEHPITEFITGQDLVKWQLLVAAGYPLPLEQKDLVLNGHAFEARIYAENPNNDFLPATGKLVHLSTPEKSSHVRIDTGVRQSDEVSVYYDPMIAKLIVWDSDRTSALRRLRVALEQYKVVGLTNNIGFLKTLASHPAFIRGEVGTHFIAQHRDSLISAPPKAPKEVLSIGALFLLLKEKLSTNLNPNDPYSPWTTNFGTRINSKLTQTIEFLEDEKQIKVNVTFEKDDYFTVQLDNSKVNVKPVHLRPNGDISAFINDRLYTGTVIEDSHSLHIFVDGNFYNLSTPLPTYQQGVADKGSLFSPMPGKIVKVLVEKDQAVKKGDPLLILEAMKMEHTIRSPSDGKIKNINYNLGELVEEKKLLVVIE